MKRQYCRIDGTRDLWIQSFVQPTIAKFLMRKILLIAAAISFVSTCFAQVATPSLDSALPVEMSSAVSWRFGSAYGIEALYGKAESDTDKIDRHYIHAGALFAYQPGRVVGEIHVIPADEQYQWDPSTDVLSKNISSFGRLSLTIRGNQNVSVGLGYSQGQNDVSSDTLKRISYEGSFSLRFLDVCYIAGGLQRVTETHDSANTRKWNTMLSGIALRFGDPTSSMFRLEASLGVSPKSEFDDPLLEIRRATTELQGSAEWLYGSLLFSYRYLNRTLEALDDEDQNWTIVSHRYGLGFHLGGIMFGYYRHAGLEKANENDMSTEKYQFTVSYSFI